MNIGLAKVVLLPAFLTDQPKIGTLFPGGDSHIKRMAVPIGDFEENPWEVPAGSCFVGVA